MALSQFPELAKLPKRQRLKLAEELWCSAIEDATPVSREHRALLDARWKAYKSGKAKRISMAELERRLSRK